MPVLVTGIRFFRQEKMVRFPAQKIKNIAIFVFLALAILAFPVLYSKGKAIINE